jgi:RNA polymerase sigma factor (sigma-70 family)
VDRHAGPIREHYRDVFRFVRRRVDTHADAEDITQEVFASAAAALARSSDAAPPTLGWLYTVARRRLIDEARRRRPRTVPLEVVRLPEARGDAYGGLVGRALELAVEKLPDAQRIVVVMRLLEGRSFAEIADLAGVSEAACRMRFMRGLQQLRSELERNGLTP